MPMMERKGLEIDGKDRRNALFLWSIGVYCMMYYCVWRLRNLKVCCGLKWFDFKSSNFGLFCCQFFLGKNDTKKAAPKKTEEVSLLKEIPFGCFLSKQFDLGPSG